MATVLSSVRQPFGVLGENRIRQLQSVKNRQNALVSTPSKSMKRRAPSPDLSDSENIDPGTFESDNKRKRLGLEDDVSVAKSSKIYAYTTPSQPKSNASVPIQSHSAPACSERIVKPSTRSSLATPTAAGRSPPRSINRPISRKKLAPPMVRGVSSPTLSVAAALKGTLAHKRLRPSARRAVSIDNVKPQSWFFDVFEESQDHQEYKMCEWTMTQSSAALDISDSEDRFVEDADEFGGSSDDRGKENVDPNEMVVTSATSVSHVTTADTAEMTKLNESDGPRSPLANLNTSEFYAAGLDATSVVLVSDEAVDTEDHVCETHDLSAASQQAFTFEAPVETLLERDTEAIEDVPEWARRTTLSLTSNTNEDVNTCAQENVTESEIEIWESSSAKDENENSSDTYECHTRVLVEAGEVVHVSAFDLQEL